MSSTLMKQKLFLQQLATNCHQFLSRLCTIEQFEFWLHKEYCVKIITKLQCIQSILNWPTKKSREIILIKIWDQDLTDQRFDRLNKSRVKNVNLGLCHQHWWQKLFLQQLATALLIGYAIFWPLHSSYFAFTVPGFSLDTGFVVLDQTAV